MKVRYHVNDQLSFELESADQKEIFAQLAAIQEIFQHTQCGKCKSNNVHFQVRKSKDGDEFYEVACMDCKATFAYGITKKDKALFPKYKDAEGKWIPNNGWTIWTPPAK